jgi:hypothetical protein
LRGHDIFSSETAGLVAAPWAVLTVALDWLFLVPLFLFAQPIFTLQRLSSSGPLVQSSSTVILSRFLLASSDSCWLRRPEERRGPGNEAFLLDQPERIEYPVFSVEQL